MSNVGRSSSRRDFVRLMLGGFVAPSLIWPFRKYFLPLNRPACPFAVLWGSTYYNQPYTRKLNGIAVPPMDVMGPFPGPAPYGFDYFFVGRDGTLTRPSPNLTSHKHA